MEWERYKERLHAALAAMHAGNPAADPQRARALMEQRARALARAVDPDNQPGDNPAQKRLEVVSFALGDGRYALDAAYVHAIDRRAPITLLPGAPEPFVGVTNIRGCIVAVVELANLLGVTRRRAAPSERMLVLGAGAIELAILVDAVDEIRAMARGDIRPLANAGHMRAITDDGVVLLDAESLLADPRMVLQ